MDFKSFMMEGVDGEFKFLPEGANEDSSSPSTKSVNNETLVIDVDPITAILPSERVETIFDSDDDPSDHNDEVGTSLKATTLNVDSDPKFYGEPISLCLHCRRQGLPVMLFEKVRLQRIAYAELEKKCNEAFQDLEKNPLVLDMRSEIEALQGQVNGLHREYNRLVLEEKKWVNYAHTLSILQAKVKDRAILVTKVVPGVAMKLVPSDEMGLLVAKLVKTTIFRGRCTTFKEVASLKEPFILEKMPGYHTSSKEEFNQACDGLTNASYLFLAEVTADPYASVEQLLSKKPRFLRSKHALSHFKPSSSKEFEQAIIACDKGLRPTLSFVFKDLTENP
ncbi:hypothetical protein Tco_0540482 [Tanacetum coccineum]